MRKATIVLLAVVAATWACKGRSGGGGGGGGGSGGFDRALEEAQPMFATLAAVRDAVPPVDKLQPAECPKDEFQPDGDRTQTLLRLPWNTLLRITGGDETRETTVDSQLGGFTASSFSRIAGLSGPTKEAWRYPNEGTVREAMAELERYRFAAVLYPTKVREGAFLGRNFQPGSAEGWIVVVRLEDAQPVCQAQVRAENGNAVSFQNARGGGSAQGYVTGGEAAVREDLRKQLAKAIDQTIQEMTGGAR